MGLLMEDLFGAAAEDRRVRYMRGCGSVQYSAVVRYSGGACMYSTVYHYFSLFLTIYNLYTGGARGTAMGHGLRTGTQFKF